MKIIVFIVLVTLSFKVSAQNDSSYKFMSRLDYYAAYSGNNILNPGIKFGAEYLWKSSVKEKNKKGKHKIRTHQIAFDGNLVFYWDPMSHVAVYTNYGINYTKTFTKGFQYFAGINPLGYYRSFLPETYEVSENGNVDKISLPGRSYFAPAAKVGIGKQRKGKTLNAWFLDFSGLCLMKYNARIMPVINLEYGYRFNL